MHVRLRAGEVRAFFKSVLDVFFFTQLHADATPADIRVRVSGRNAAASWLHRHRIPYSCGQDSLGGAQIFLGKLQRGSVPVTRFGSLLQQPLNISKL